MPGWSPLGMASTAARVDAATSLSIRRGIAEAVNDVAALTDAIRDMVEARDSHEEWARYLRAHPSLDPQEVKIAGDAAYHVEWVGKYDRVLTILRTRRNSLRSRSRRG